MSKGTVIDENNVEEYLQYYKIDLEWAKNKQQLPSSSSLKDAFAASRNLSGSDIRLVLKNINESKNTFTINKYIDYSKNIIAIIVTTSAAKRTSTARTIAPRTTTPRDAMVGGTMEMELLNRYIDPSLQPLFDDFDNDTMFRWTSTTNTEAVKKLDLWTSKQVTFYATKLMHGGLYAMMEIAFIEIPVSLYKLIAYIVYLSDFLDVLHVLYDQCVPETEQGETRLMQSRKQATLRTTEMNWLLNSTGDRKRRCMTTYYT
ncbi:hypothetical protein BC941DRAFT_473138 [Chlamydoabsidia padenii]|nr:hypothetical protein BC941DRAFT_473138 [Chlamydoabsidia padenii]